MSTLAELVQARRADKVRRQMEDDKLHGRSLFPELEPDGADAFCHGYGLETCPYANRAALDDTGRIAALPPHDVAKAAAWRKGWLDAQVRQISN